MTTLTVVRDKNIEVLDPVGKAYDSPYWWYDIRGFFILTLSYNSTLWRQIAFFQRNISCNHLEVAIGSGALFSMILRWHRWKGCAVGQVVGIDYAKSMLAGAVKRFSRDLKVHLLHQDVARMSFGDQSFDSANIANSIHSFFDVDGGLRDLFRVLKPGAELRYNALLYPTRGRKILRSIASWINRWGMKKGILHSPFTEQDILDRTRAAGFVITEATRSGHALNVVALKPQERIIPRSAPPMMDISLDTALNKKDFQREAFARNHGILSLKTMEKLRTSCVAIPGLGGVGGQHLLALTRSGVGQFRLAEFDRYEIVNLNRQVGATVKTIGREKMEVMVAQALDINPTLQIRTYPNGINESNLEDFLTGADVVVDGLDAFAITLRRRLFQAARDRWIPVITAGPMGYGAALLVFTPEGMSADDYFDWRDGMTEMELQIAFFSGLSPRLPHLTYIDPTTIDLHRQQGPSLYSACLLCSSLAVTEVIRCLTEPDTVRAAPQYTTIDPYMRRLYQGRLLWGNRSPWRRLLRRTAYRSLQHQRKEAKDL